MSSFAAGSARVEITPESSVPMFGAAVTEKWSSGTHDPLYARAVVVSQNETTLGIVSLDSARCTGALYESIREVIVDEGPLDELMISASHTHYGPYLHDAVDEETGFFPQEYGFTADNAAATFDSFKTSVISILEDATQSQTPATLRMGRAQNNEVSINRRSDGGVFGHVDYPPTVEDSRDFKADVDPELIALYIQTETDDVILYNYPLHPNVFGGSEFSADFPGVVAEEVAEGRDGPQVMYLNGAAGDVIHRYAGDRDHPFPSSEDYLRWAGELLAETVDEAIANALDDDPFEPTLHIQSLRYELPYRGFDSNILRNLIDNHLEKLNRDIERTKPHTENPVMTADPESPVRKRYHLNRLKTLDEWPEEPAEPIVTAVTFGDLQLLTVPGEPFVQHGLDLKERATTPLMVAGYTNDYLGYFPTREAYRYGGYEVETARVSPGTISGLRQQLFHLID